MGHIRVLSEDTARQIAAGEVIDRPYSIIRELLDNAIDAGGRNIRVEIMKGGLERIRVVDDGSGMDEEDLRLCALRHATSKIDNIRDLTRVSTLGFRGEALASIGACSTLSLTSRRADSRAAYRALVRFGRADKVIPYAGVPGTIAEVTSLFFELPARRRFLKSQGAETALCRRTFLEKAFPHPEIAFDFAVDGKPVQKLVAASAEERVAAAAGLNIDDVTYVEEEKEGLQLSAVLARWELGRRDRSGIHIYLNRRRITDFSLVQAVEYGYGDFLPGGLHPVAFLFVDIEPGLVDFNVHPAKREVRLRRPGELHRAISETLQRELRSWQSEVRYETKSLSEAERSPASLLADGNFELPSLARHSIQEISVPEESIGPLPSPVDLPRTWRGRAPAPDAQMRYLGQAFQLFLVAEVTDHIYFVDQHAAHERVLYEDLRGGEIARQQLMAGPLLDFSLEQETELRRFLPDLEKCGFRLRAESDGHFRITEIPTAAARLPASQLGSFIHLCAGTPDDWDRDLYSNLACRLAIKQGEVIDDESGQVLLERSFRINPQRCPHGRPLWFEISRAALEGSVGR